MLKRWTGHGVNTPDMVNNLDGALKALGWTKDYQYLRALFEALENVTAIPLLRGVRIIHRRAMNILCQRSGGQNRALTQYRYENPAAAST
jgi:hypothetical protein